MGQEDQKKTIKDYILIVFLLSVHFYTLLFLFRNDRIKMQMKGAKSYEL